jgi:hypothetical protein
MGLNVRAPEAYAFGRPEDGLRSLFDGKTR